METKILLEIGVWYQYHDLYQLSESCGIRERTGILHRVRRRQVLIHVRGSSPAVAPLPSQPADAALCSLVFDFGFC